MPTTATTKKPRKPAEPTPTTLDGIINPLPRKPACEPYKFRRPHIKSSVINPHALKAFRSAIDVLRSDTGFLVEEDWTCCQSCGWAAMETHPEARGEKPPAVAFYHAQDRESLEETGQCYLSFGGYSMSDEDAAINVVTALWSRGLSVIWNGSANTRVLVDLTVPPV